MYDNIPVLPLPELKRWALTNRTTKLIGWLGREEYAFVRHPQSSDKFIKLINLIIYALEQSVPKADWRPFYSRFYDLKSLVYTIEIEDEKEAIYNESLYRLKVILQDYRDYIAEYNFKF